MSTITHYRTRILCALSDKSAVEGHLNSTVNQGGGGFPVALVVQAKPEAGGSATHCLTETQLLPSEQSMLEATAAQNNINHGVVAIWVDYGDGRGPQKEAPDNPSQMLSDMGLVLT